MVTRIVKMTFREEATADFQKVFDKYKEQIRHADGCTHLTLLREKPNGTVFFTYSKWEDESFLEKYRHSSIFAEVWPQTKTLFAAPAQAWTVNEEVVLR